MKEITKELKSAGRKDSLIFYYMLHCVSVPGVGVYDQVRHPCRRSLAHHWALVVQDKHLVLTDFRHKVEVLLQTQSQSSSSSETTTAEELRSCLPEPCRCDRSGRPTWLQDKHTLSQVYDFVVMSTLSVNSVNTDSDSQLKPATVSTRRSCSDSQSKKLQLGESLLVELVLGTPLLSS